MKKVEKWIADDGKEFETEQECYAYENMYNTIYENAVFLDDNFNIIKVNDDNFYRTLCNCYALYVPNEEIAEKLHLAFAEDGIESPFGSHRPYGKGLFYYEDIWRSIDEELEDIKQLHSKLYKAVGLE